MSVDVEDKNPLVHLASVLRKLPERNDTCDMETAEDGTQFMLYRQCKKKGSK